MATQPHYLVSFENVSASVGGYDISSITEVHLEAASNSIPTITLLVDAGHSESGKPSVVDTVSLDNARTIFDNCREMVQTSGGTLKLSLTARAVGDGGSDVQTLGISGWLLTDVSLSPIQESGVCTVALTFMHPICKSDFGGAVPGLLAAPLTFEDLTGDNPVDVFVDALRIYGESAIRNEPLSTKNVPGASDPTTVRDNLIGRLTSATSNLLSCVTWSGGGLPAENQLEGWDHLLRCGLTVYAMPSGGTSVFQRFAKYMVPECSLAMGGDYTQTKLEVGPFMPWAAASMTMKDSDIVSLQFPQNDPTPISGVKITANDTTETAPSSYHVDTSQIDVKPADIFYVPDSEIAAEFMYGPIQQFQEPGWLRGMMAYQLMTSDKGRSDIKSAKSGKFQIAASTSRGQGASFSGASKTKVPQIDYSSAMLACAKAYYETMLMKDWSFNINARLMFRNGGVICPGKVISVESGSGEILSGYVTSVVHSISVANKTARTSITCTHPRFGQLPQSITTTTNALYE